MMKSVVLAAALWAIAAPAALACGHCEEDRIALTYDHAVVLRALERRQEVAFFSVEAANHHASAQQITRVLRGLRGIERNSIRTSADPLGLSFAYDPAKVALGSIVEEANAKLRTVGMTVALLRVMKGSTHKPV